MSAPLAELAVRFAAFSLLLAGVGAGPASLLPSSWPARARVALAPVLGLCLAACGATTLEWLAPADRWYPALPATAALSLLVAAGRARRARAGGPRAGGPRAGAGPRAGGGVRGGLLVAGELLVVVAAAFLPVATALAAHGSVGPMSYEVYDGPGYVANAEAAATVSIRTASTETSVASYVQRWWHLDTASPNRLDDAPVVAGADALLGLDATQTYVANLLAVLAAGGLGLYAAVVVAAPRARRLAAPLAGAAFGGSFFLQLVFDGSQAALTGLAVLVPLLVLLVEAARRPRAGTLAVLSLALAGLGTLYPIFLFPVVVVVGGAVAVLAARSWRGRRVAWRPWLVRGAGVAVLAALGDVVATVRDARSLSSIATGGGILSSFPAYHLGAGVAGSWLLQTRDLYGVAFGAQSPLADVVPALLVPLAVLAVALPPLRREPVAWLALALVAVSVLLGAYEQVRHGCGYCEDRSMLSAVPPLAFLVFAGLGTALSSGRAGLVAVGRASRSAGAAIPGHGRGAARLGTAVVAMVAASYVGLVAYSSTNARARYAAGSLYVTGAERALVDRISPAGGPVELEGLGTLPSSFAAEPYAYELLVARHVAVSVATAEEGAGLASDWGPRPVRPPWFDPSYRLVLTRLGALVGGRRRVATAGMLTLERRVAPVGVTVESGLGFSSPTSRLATVTGPLRLVVSGARGPVAVRVRTALPGRPTGSGGASAVHCAVVEERSGVRGVTLDVRGGATVLGVSAVAGRC